MMIERKVNIRKDLGQVEGLISRLISIGQEFGTMDSRWSHMKNNEDFERVYAIVETQKKHSIEEVYATGRDMALFMSDALQSINVDFTTYPSLTSIIDRFKDTWIDSDLNKIKTEGEEAHEGLGLNNWAFRQILIMFEDQINLAKAVKQTLNLLKDSDLYKLENETLVKENSSNIININNVTNSNISVSSDNTSQEIKQSRGVFIKIIEAVESSDIEDKDQLIMATKEMEDAARCGNIAGAYKNFIALASNHMGIIAPFIPALSVLL